MQEENNVQDVTTDDTNVNADVNQDDVSDDNNTNNNQDTQTDKEDQQDQTDAEDQQTEEKTRAPENYELPELPDGFEIADDVKTALFEMGKKHDVTQDAMNDFIKEHVKTVQAMIKANEDAIFARSEDLLAGWETGLKKNWGDKLDANMKIVDKTVNRFMKSDDLKDTLLGAKVDGKRPPINPLFAEMLLEIGNVMSEDTFETGVSSGDTETYNKYSDILPQTNVKKH